MMDLCKYSKQNYVMSILGKEVTVSKNKIGGASEAITGIAEKVLIETGSIRSMSMVSPMISANNPDIR